jgi:hypothetical protein
MRLQSRPQYLTAALVLALAALALLPAFARAGGSAEITYFGGPPTLESNPEAHANKPAPAAKSHGPGPSNASPTPQKPTVEAKATEPPSEPEGEAETSHRERSKAAPPAKPGNRPPGASGHHGQKAGAKQPGGSPQASKSPSKGPKTTTGVNASDTSGGSSPVGPILIAMAILAALSIAVALYRDRRGNPSASA